MGSSDSRWIELLRRFRRRGLRYSINSAATILTQKYFSNPLSVLPNFEDVLKEEHPASLAPSPSGSLMINWVLPGIEPAGGGLLNIFRTIQQLESWGHVNRVYLLGKVPGGDSAAARERIRDWYFPIHSDVKALSGQVEDSDALIATSWPTAYAVRSIGNTAHKFYFVQDIEYMFYAAGSLHEFVRQTYQFGFRGITLGSWVADVLAREFNMECSPFGFSYDRSAYSNTGDNFLPERKKRVLFYARPSSERRGFELGILALSLVAKRMPEVEFVLVGSQPQSLNVPFPAMCPGVLPVSELGALYRSCDVALVLSHTNLSMLPLELMACGCAVVSNTGPNVEWLLTDEVAQLAKPDPRSLAEAVIELLQSDSLRLRKIKAARAFAESTDWTREIRTIESVLLAGKEHSHSPARGVQWIQS
jgi:glycosyltransferase involved in cell wall biosynthesis